jgi:hypothetical protein
LLAGEVRVVLPKLTVPAKPPVSTADPSAYAATALPVSLTVPPKRFAHTTAPSAPSRSAKMSSLPEPYSLLSTGVVRVVPPKLTVPAKLPVSTADPSAYAATA